MPNNLGSNLPPERDVSPRTAYGWISPYSTLLDPILSQFHLLYAGPWQRQFREGDAGPVQGLTGAVRDENLAKRGLDSPQPARPYLDRALYPAAHPPPVFDAALLCLPDEAETVHGNAGQTKGERKGYREDGVGGIRVLEARRSLVFPRSFLLSMAAFTGLFFNNQFLAARVFIPRRVFYSHRSLVAAFCLVP